MPNPQIHETKTHGKITFPYIIYRGNIPEYIVSYPLHWHEEMEFIYVVNGIGIVTVQKQRYLLHSGDLIVIAPEIIHSIEQYKDATMEYFNLLFKLPLLANSIGDCCYETYLKPFSDYTKVLPNFLPAGNELNNLLTPYILNLIENRKKSYSGYELMVKSNLYAIMYHLNQYATLSTITQKQLQSNYEKIKILLQYLKENYHEPISIKDAANLCHFSESHFMKLFKNLTGSGFTQYLKNYRLEIAAKQILETKKHLIDIAQDVGFNNASYFTRSFTKKYGASPSDFKKLHH